MSAIWAGSLAAQIVLLTVLVAPRTFGQLQYLRTTNLDVVADATISSAVPDANFGNQLFVSAGVDGNGTNRGLIQFGATRIPTNATIKSVTLSLAVLSSPPAGVQFVLSRLLNHWDRNVCTWNRRSYSAWWPTKRIS